MRPVRAALLLACSWAHADDIDWAGLELDIETSVLYSPPGSTIQRDTEALISIFNNTAALQVLRAFAHPWCPAPKSHRPCVPIVGRCV